jgi:hypothetical protein
MPIFDRQAVANTVGDIAGQLENAAQQARNDASEEQAQQISAGIEELRRTAASLGQAQDASQAQSLIQSLLTGGNTVLGVLSTLPLPSSVAGVVRIVQLLLPTVVGAAGVLWPGQMPQGGAQQSQGGQQGQQQAQQAPGQQAAQQPPQGAQQAPQAGQGAQGQQPPPQPQGQPQAAQTPPVGQQIGQPGTGQQGGGGQADQSPQDRAADRTVARSDAPVGRTP